MAEGKVVLWRSMYHPQGHQMLAEAGLDVVVVDSANADEIKQVVYVHAPCGSGRPSV
jgi:2-keto-3-deoxy-L-rhamnonate aldolase RhmA